MNGQIIPGTCIAVDFWKIRGMKEQLVHFLTHIHGDHIVGLTSSWMRPIYCSEFTAKLLEAHYGVPRHLMIILELNQCTLVKIPSSSDSFCVTAFDANHCPGALMLYFEGTFGNIFHTGDFRFSNDLMTETLHSLEGKIDKLYLDNTFCSQDCNFPTREECQEEIIEIVKNHPDSDVLIGIRKLGKESMLAKLGIALNETIFVSPERFQILQCLFDTNVFSVAGKDESARIKTLPLHSITKALLHNMNKVKPTIAIMPTAIFTGLSCKPFHCDPNIYVVPYSDHSSFSELVEFVKRLQPRQIIPIVKHTKGPFGKDISCRSDMSLFESYLRVDKISNQCVQSKSDITKDTCENYSQAVEFSCTYLNEESTITSCKKPSNMNLIDDDKRNKYFIVRLGLSVCEKRLIPTSLKRKKSFPDKKKKKVAKGVTFPQETTEEPHKIFENAKIHSDSLKNGNDKNVVTDSVQLDNDNVENLIVLRCEQDSADSMVTEYETSNVISKINEQENFDNSAMSPFPDFSPSGFGCGQDVSKTPDSISVGSGTAVSNCYKVDESDCEKTITINSNSDEMSDSDLVSGSQVKALFKSNVSVSSNVVNSNGYDEMLNFSCIKEKSKEDNEKISVNLSNCNSEKTIERHGDSKSALPRNEKCNMVNSKVPRNDHVMSKEQSNSRCNEEVLERCEIPSNHRLNHASSLHKFLSLKNNGKSEITTIRQLLIKGHIRSRSDHNIKKRFQEALSKLMNGCSYDLRCW